MKITSILGLNARSQLFSYPYNRIKGKKIARSKILTSRILRAAKIPTPKIIAKFKNPSDILSFDWESLPDSFALKPSKGLGGEGIIIVKKRSKRESKYWITTQKERLTVEDLKLQILDILEGAYSVGHVPDFAFIQEYVGCHRSFRKYSFRGTPDIRVIVFNKVPVMAMLRLPTRESGGRANLHQGAIGVGVDMATGITTRAIWHGDQIRYKPETQKKLLGIKIPDWDKVLELAVKSQEVSGLGYLGVDLVLHPEKGPMVLEINAHPGLQIQLANMAGLKKRLERIEDLGVRDVDHGVKIAKALFISNLVNRITQEPRIVSVNEDIKVKLTDRKYVKVPAKIDTGAWRTSIDKGLAYSLGLLTNGNILWTKRVKSSLGTEDRPVINLSYRLKGKRINTIAGVSDRKNLKKSVIIGRRDLSGFLVRPVIFE